MPKGSEKKWKSSNAGNKSYQLTSAGRSAHGWQIGRHWLAGNSYFLRQRIFIFCFSEPLSINIEDLNSLLLGIQLFIQIYFDGLWYVGPNIHLFGGKRSWTILQAKSSEKKSTKQRKPSPDIHSSHCKGVVVFVHLIALFGSLHWSLIDPLLVLLEWLPFQTDQQTNQ